MKYNRINLDTIFDEVGKTFERINLEDFGKRFEKFTDINYPIVRTNENRIGNVNVMETPENITIEIMAPGFTRDEINVEVDNGMVNITGESKTEKEDKGKNYSKREFSKISFKRSFAIPENANEEVSAKLDSGILKLEIKKKESVKPTGKKINID